MRMRLIAGVVAGGLLGAAAAAATVPEHYGMGHAMLLRKAVKHGKRWIRRAKRAVASYGLCG